jgi:bis(5'-nucleosyl)-tetraphosphatase (symmetrical)
MAIYAIGDIQGCFDEFCLLLDKVGFDKKKDRLWLTGDLVNRGPKSLEVLRFVRSLGDAAITVLGNHDLHLLAIAAKVEKARKKDTLQAILNAPDRDELLEWLRLRPLLHHDVTSGYTLIHAGLPPQWDLVKSQACATEVETVLHGPDYVDFFQHMYGDTPHKWDEILTGWERLRFITNCFTRLRYCDPKGRLMLTEKGAPGSQPEGLQPWFRVPGRLNKNMNLVFGHWSTLGEVNDSGIYPLDTGCVWGGKLTALHVEADLARTDMDCRGASRPGEP